MGLGLRSDGSWTPPSAQGGDGTSSEGFLSCQQHNARLPGFPSHGKCGAIDDAGCIGGVETLLVLALRPDAKGTPELEHVLSDIHQKPPPNMSSHLTVTAPQLHWESPYG